MKSPSIPHYRSDIDGLRALAVLSVLLFHGFPQSLPGGFAGVDVFFVISGYLITGILWRENVQGRFSLASFYARRVRRIFPALLLVLLVCTLAGWWLLFDDEYKQLGDHTMRAGVFLSNFVLWREAGYFDARAELKPLLHLWSLAIEEQFYVVWPGVIWLVHRKCREPLKWLFGLALISFGWNVFQSLRDPVHDFYSPLTRFWELMVGALLAVKTIQSPQLLTLTQKRVLSWTGMFLLVTAMVLLQGGVAYPGVWALWPVLGAVCYIAAEGPPGAVQRLMGSRGMLWVGEISYALYLWHWPVLSFLRIVEGRTPHAVVQAMGLLLSLLLAALTVRWLERHFRYGPIQRSKITFLLLAMVAVFIWGHLINKNRGFPQRELMQAAHVAHAGPIGHDSFHQEMKDRFHPCANQKIMQAAAEWQGIKRCFQSKPEGSIDFLLLGDSHAEQLFVGLAEALPQRHVAYYQQGGLPLLSNPRFALIFDELLKDRKIATVLITTQWQSRMKEIPADQNLVTELVKTIQALQASGKQVVLLDDVYQFDFDPQRCKYARPLAGGTTCSAPIEQARAQHAPYWLVLKEVQQRLTGVRLIRIGDALCTDLACSMLVDGQMAYRDSHHLNGTGSRWVAQALVSQLRPAQ